jgi:hypothetical protein
MKIIGYGWIKSGETLKQAMDRYGVPEDIKPGKNILNAEKALFKVKREAKQDFEEKTKEHEHRKSTKPRFFRVVLQEV